MPGCAPAVAGCCVPRLRALHEAAEDRHVVGLIAKVGGVWPWGTMQELRLGVQAFAASGKPTLAWAESFGEGSARDMAAYVLATAFGEVWLQPGGGIGLLGVGIETTFLRGTLDRLGVEPQVEQRHEYKNAADLVVHTEYTPAHREALERLGRIGVQRCRADHRRCPWAWIMIGYAS